MPTTDGQLELPLTQTPAALLVLAAVAAALVWWTLYRLARGRGLAVRRTLLVMRLLVGVAAWLTALLSAGRVLTYVGLPMWPVVVVCGALGVEWIVTLSQFERRSVSRRVGRGLLLLRLALLLLVLATLLQPTLRSDRSRTMQRYVAVLVDDSASMRLADAAPTAAEQLQLGRLFGAIDPPALTALIGAAEQWRQIEQSCRLQAGWIDAIAAEPTDTARRHLTLRRAALDALRTRCGELANANADTLRTAIEAGDDDTPLAQRCWLAISMLDALTEGSLARLDELLSAVDRPASPIDFDALRSTVRELEQRAGEMAGQIDPLPASLAEAYLASLPEVTRQAVDRAAQQARWAIATHVLTHADPDGSSLLKVLGEQYALRLYRFATSAESLDVAQVGDALATSPEPVAWHGGTDLAGALAQVEADVPIEQLAGVLVLTDGRHNTDAPLEPAARRLAVGGAPVCSVLIGSEAVPQDAAIAEVHRPETVFLGDRLVMRTRLKLDGLRGKQVTVRLICDEEVVDRRQIDVPEDHFRPTVLLGDEPPVAGAYDYRVELLSGVDEHVTENNSRRETVVVTDERIKVLLADRRPRWEFRYVKNLFAGRDKTVQLQHVLTDADRIAGLPRPSTPASVTRPYGQFEATELPTDPSEWLKFDVIVLGDVSPSVLDATRRELLVRFVARRGGTLIVIAGPESMPHDFADTELADLLPMLPAETPTGSSAGVPPFRLSLTEAGQTHVIMTQGPTVDDTRQVWQRMPTLYWRSVGLHAKPTATVLAYAETLDGPEQPSASPASPLRAAEAQRQRDRRQRERALISVHPYGAGNVLMLSFDRTWRLRYREGDRYHHQFWGQVLRWASTGKLAAGTALVRLGTDRARYRPHQPLVVRARLLDQDAQPVEADDVFARVWHEGQQILTRRLAMLPDSQGRYEANLGRLPRAGSYRIVLGGPTVEQLLAQVEAPVDSVATEVAVAHLSVSDELVELSADRQTPLRLAGLTGGEVVSVADAAGLIGQMGSPSRTVVESRVWNLWDSWPWLTLMLVVVCSEWILRKKVGLT